MFMMSFSLEGWGSNLMSSRSLSIYSRLRDYMGLLFGGDPAASGLLEEELVIFYSACIY